MNFKIIKSSFDGVSGGESLYRSIEEVLRNIGSFDGWDSLSQLHKSIKKWSKDAIPGSVFTTRHSAIVAISESVINDGECPYCGEDYRNIEYGELFPVDGGDIEQRASCTKCSKSWIDVFALKDRRLINKKT